MGFDGVDVLVHARGGVHEGRAEPATACPAGCIRLRLNQNSTETLPKLNRNTTVSG